MKKLIGLILILGIAVGLGVTVKSHPGMVVVQWGAWRIDAPLWLALGGILVSVLVCFALYSFFMGVFRTPQKIVNLKHQWDTNHARKQMHQGLMALVEGRWQVAGRHLLHSVDKSEAPLLNYLGLAKVAQEQGDDKSRDHYLKLAHEQDASAKMAIGLTQAQLQYQHGQYEQSLATLKHLQVMAPHHPRILALLKRLYQQLGEWDQLYDILPKLKKAQVINDEAFLQLEREVFLQKLTKAEKEPTQDSLKALWKKLPKKFHTDVVMVYQYANALIAHRDPFAAETCLRQALKREWRESLVRLYGLIDHPEPDKLLAQAEGWLRMHGESASLMLTLGRLSCSAHLWGKAERYLEASLNLKPDIEAYTELACLYEKLDKRELSHQFFRKGATMVSAPVLERLPTPRIHVEEPPSDAVG